MHSMLSYYVTEKMQNIVLEALEIMKRRQYNLWRNASDEQKGKIELDPVAITEKAIKNCCPIMILRPFIRGKSFFCLFPIQKFLYRNRLQMICKMHEENVCLHQSPKFLHYPLQDNCYLL